MAGIRYADVTPAINLFNANVAKGDLERRQEEQDFARRFQMERAIGLDRGLRDAFAKGIPAAPVAASGATVADLREQEIPGPAAAPAIASYSAQPTPSFPPSTTTDLGQGFGEEARLPAAATAPAMPVAAPVAAAPVALPTARPSPRAGAGSYREIMTALSKTPGAGATMMNLYSSERKDRAAASLEERKLHMEGIKLFTDASKNGDVATMRAVSQRYDLGIPPEALNRREIMANIAAGVNTAKSIGISDDERAIAFGMGYIEALATGADPRAAIQAGFAAAQKVQVTRRSTRAPHYYTAADNTVQAVDEDLVARPVTGPKARPPQPPFAITPGGIEARDQGLRDRAIDNAMKEAGRRWDRMSPDEKQRRIDYHYEFLKSGKPGALPPSRGGAAPGAAASAAAPGRPSLESFYK